MWIRASQTLPPSGETVLATYVQEFDDGTWRKSCNVVARRDDAWYDLQGDEVDEPDFWLAIPALPY